MDWFYLQMREMHLILAWCSFGVFAARGLAYQLGATWPLDSRLSVLVFGIDMTLTMSGLSLWGLLSFNPLSEPWLACKLLALCGYTACAYWALGRGEFHVLGYLGALLCMAYMMAVSLVRTPLLGL